jgi:hypothetical protein
VSGLGECRLMVLMLSIDEWESKEETGDVEVCRKLQGSGHTRSAMTSYLTWFVLFIRKNAG